MENILLGLTTAIAPANLLACLLGTCLGIAFGAMPGLSATIGIAVLIPVSYGMEPATGLILLAGVYVGATYGGSISAILVNTPGTPSAAATSWDGHPMALNGHATEALIESATASFWGTMVGFAALLTIAPGLAEFSLRFSTQENVCLAVFGLTIIASLSKDIIKGLIGGCIGLLLGTFGMDPQYGFPRFIFGQMELLTGFPTVPTLVGLYSISQVLSMVAKRDGTLNMEGSFNMLNKYRLKLRDLCCYPITYLWCGIVGVIIGIIPAAGTSIAAFMGYNEAKRISKTPELFGTGHLSAREGLALVAEAARLGCQMVLTHADNPADQYTVEQQVEAARQGAFVEHCFFTTYFDRTPIAEIAAQIRAVGCGHVILATDFGQPQSPYSDEGMLRYIQMLLDQGFTQKELYQMTAENPKFLISM